MKVIRPLAIDDATLTASNVPETDHAAWDGATSYTVGQRVILVSTHSVYEAVAISTDRTPGLPANIFSDQNPGGVWLRVGATNRWKAFDQRLNDPVTQSGTIAYTLTGSQLSDGLAFFNLAALIIDLRVTDPTMPLRNLTTFSEQFNNGVWIKQNSSASANAATAPDGTITAEKLVENTANSTHHIVRTLAYVSGQAFTFSVYVKAVERNRVNLQIPGPAFGSYISLSYDLLTGSIFGTTPPPTVKPIMEALPNGWYRIGWTATATATVSAGTLIVRMFQNPNILTYTGDDTSGVLVWGAQLEAGELSRYQRTGDTGDFSKDTFSERREIVDTSSIVDWFTFFTWDAEFQTEAVFAGFPGYGGHAVDITIDNGASTAAVGQIVLGRLGNLGTTIQGTEIGIQDFSTKERDTFGNVILVQRAFAQKVSFKFAMPVQDERRVQRIVSELRGIPAVYFASMSTLDRGTLIYGFYPDFSIPLSSAGVSFATLDIEGLI